MKNINVFILAVLIICSACRKEEIILEDPVVTTTPPVVVDGAFYSGQIIDLDGLAVETKIEVYQSGELQGTISSDETGHYSTETLPLQLGEDVTFAIENENYANKYRRLTAQQEVNENQNFRLIPKDENSILPDNPLFNPGSADLVKAYGTFTDKFDTPIQNADVMLFYDVTLPGTEPQIYYGLFDKTDENGYIEFLVPNDKEIFFYAVPDRDDFVPFCWATISEEEVYGVISPLIAFDALGVLIEDTELIEKEGLSLTQFESIVYGELLDCEGLPVGEGTVTLEVKFVSNGVPATQTFTTDSFDENGQYWFEFPICSEVMDIKIIAETAEGFFANISVNGINSGGIHLAPLRACDETNTPNFVRSTMELAIGDDYFFGEINFVHEVIPQPYNFAGSSLDPEAGFILLDIQDLKVGENPILRFVVDFFNNEPRPFAFSSALGELTANVTTIENGIIDGYIIGDVETVGLGTQTINAKFKIQYE